MKLRSNSQSTQVNKENTEFSSDSSLTPVPSDFSDSDSSEGESLVKQESVSPGPVTKASLPGRKKVLKKEENPTKKTKTSGEIILPKDTSKTLKGENVTLTDSSLLKYFPLKNPEKKISIKREKSTNTSPKVFSNKKVTKRVIREEPENWKMVYEKIAEYRRTHTAPVDTMGCERLGDTKAEPKSFRFQTLLSLMLSSRTKDEVTAEAIKKLGQLGEITAKSILEMDGEVLRQCISKVGFHHSKKDFIQRTAKICVDQYDGDIPDTVEGLVKLPGVGPKMAYLTMQCAWFKNTGIGVDIHVHRISNRLGWVKTTDPEATRLALEDWLPQEYWKGINPLLVGFGQIMCRGIKPKCPECPVAQWCPSSHLVKSTRSK